MTSNFYLLMLFLGCFLVISVSSKKLYLSINYDYFKPTEHIFYFRVLPSPIYKDSNDLTTIICYIRDIDS